MGNRLRPFLEPNSDDLGVCRSQNVLASRIVDLEKIPTRDGVGIQGPKLEGICPTTSSTKGSNSESEICRPSRARIARIFRPTAFSHVNPFFAPKTLQAHGKRGYQRDLRMKLQLSTYNLQPQKIRHRAKIDNQNSS